jgi:hypothetical protein
MLKALNSADIGKDIQIIGWNNGVVANTTVIITLTANYQRVTVTHPISTVIGSPSIWLFGSATNTANSCFVKNILIEQISGQTNQNPSEYLSIGEIRKNLTIWSENLVNWGTKFNCSITTNTFTRNSITPAYATPNIITKPALALPYTMSCLVKKITGDYCAIRLQGSFPERADVVFNLTTGVVSFPATAYSGMSSVSATITPNVD